MWLNVDEVRKKTLWMITFPHSWSLFESQQKCFHVNVENTRWRADAPRSSACSRLVVVVLHGTGGRHKGPGVVVSSRDGYRSSACFFQVNKERSVKWKWLARKAVQLQHCCLCCLKVAGTARVLGWERLAKQIWYQHFLPLKPRSGRIFSFFIASSSAILTLSRGILMVICLFFKRWFSGLDHFLEQSHYCTEENSSSD